MSPALLKAVFNLGLGIAGLGGIGLVAACWPAHPHIQWTVINATNEELVTWAIEEECDVIVGYRGSYSDEATIRPGGRLDYHEDSSKDGCIQVATTDRRLVHARDYESGAEIVVSQPLTFLSERIPREGDLEEASHPSLAEVFITAPDTRLVTFYVSFALVAIGGLGSWLASRGLRRRGIQV